MAKILWLRKQKHFLEAREYKMLKQGLRFLDELNTIEEAEKIVAAVIPLSIGDFEFPEIPLDPVEAAAF
jgi:hypothetical protein